MSLYDLADTLTECFLHTVAGRGSIELIDGKKPIKGDEDLLNEKITVSFESLTIEESLRRILNRFDYTMTFDSDGMPTSVYIYGKGNKPGDIRATRRVSRSGSNVNRVEQIENQKASQSSETTTPRFKRSTLGEVKPIKIPIPPEPIDPDNPTRGAAPRGSY